MTIYALSSGPGISGIAVIRVSGKQSKKILSTLTGLPLPKERMASLRKIKNNKTNELIDEGIVLWLPGPNSYTGDDMVEFHIHGSKAVIDELQNVISNFDGCRIAEAGEFTKLAFQNNKINLLKAESIGDLIASETELQRKQALRIMSGQSSTKFNNWREELIKILSDIEAKIDFPDEDIPTNISNEIYLKSKKIYNEIKKTLDDDKAGEIIREGFRIAIIGPPNVGKSSLLNYLSKREAAIVSEKAGTTRDVIEVHLDLEGIPVIVSDTAGIRNSTDEVESKGIKMAKGRAEEADLIVLLLDPKNLDFKGFLKDAMQEKSIIAINKSDTGINGLERFDAKTKPIIMSIKEDYSVDKLINKIKSNLKEKFLKTENILITRSRHRQHLEQVCIHINSFLEKKDNEEFDKASEDLRLAIRHLGTIVGKVDIEEILGSIFQNFCIGK